jgi:Raf kinase inhibitor-like YbhB/YbcL family protein
MKHFAFTLALFIAACSSAPVEVEPKEPEPSSLAELPTEAVQPTPMPQPTEGEQLMALEIRSVAFEHEGEIPAKYSCDGEDISPELGWSGAPEGTQSWAIIMDDPDAPVGIWVHWVLYNLPAEATGLAEGSEGSGSGGSNSWNRMGYGGPCPPSGTHRYFFKLYALDSELELSEGVSKEELLAAMEGHILAEAELMGTYARGG